MNPEDAIRNFCEKIKKEIRDMTGEDRVDIYGELTCDIYDADFVDTLTLEYKKEEKSLDLFLPNVMEKTKSSEGMLSFEKMQSCDVETGENKVVLECRYGKIPIGDKLSIVFTRTEKAYYITTTVIGDDYYADTKVRFTK